MIIFGCETHVGNASPRYAPAMGDWQLEEEARALRLRYIRPHRGQIRRTVRRSNKQDSLRGKAGALLQRHVEVSRRVTPSCLFATELLSAVWLCLRINPTP